MRQSSLSKAISCPTPTICYQPHKKKCSFAWSPRFPYSFPRLKNDSALKEASISWLRWIQTIRDSLKIWESSTTGCKHTSLNISQRPRNLEMTPTVIAPWISKTQALLVRASKTVLLLAFLLDTKAKTWGARSATLCPWIQRSVQNKVLWPSPTSDTTTMEEKCHTPKIPFWVVNSFH